MSVAATRTGGTGTARRGVTQQLRHPASSARGGVRSKVLQKQEGTPPIGCTPAYCLDLVLTYSSMLSFLVTRVRGDGGASSAVEGALDQRETTVLFLGEVSCFELHI